MKLFLLVLVGHLVRASPVFVFFFESVFSTTKKENKESKLGQKG